MAITVNVQDAAGIDQVDAFVRGYKQNAETFLWTEVSRGYTDENGQVVLGGSLGTGVRIHVQPNRADSAGWVGPVGVIIGDGPELIDLAGSFDNGETVTAYINYMIDPLADPDAPFAPLWTYWKDTTDDGTILRLMKGEERRPFSNDMTDPLYRHVLVGPFLTYAEAVAA
jgi:hypothetical protein